MVIDIDLLINENGSSHTEIRQEGYYSFIASLHKQLRREIHQSAIVYEEVPIFYHLTLRMEEKWMRQFSRKSSERSQAIWDVSSMLIGRINQRLVRHPKRTCNQQYNLQFWAATENRTKQGFYTDEHSHILLMVHPEHVKKWSDPCGLEPLVQFILNKSSTFSAMGVETHFARDCHSVDVKHISTFEQFQNTIDYGFKTATDRNSENAFTITNQDSWSKIYEEQGDKRQNNHVPFA